MYCHYFYSVVRFQYTYILNIDYAYILFHEYYCYESHNDNDGHNMTNVSNVHSNNVRWVILSLGILFLFLITLFKKNKSSHCPPPDLPSQSSSSHSPRPLLEEDVSLLITLGLPSPWASSLSRNQCRPS